MPYFFHTSYIDKSIQLIYTTTENAQYETIHVHHSINLVLTTASPHFLVKVFINTNFLFSLQHWEFFHAKILDLFAIHNYNLPRIDS